MESLEFDYDFHKHHELKIKKGVYKSKGLCGLINIGNKCYVNSILQCLSHSLKLTDYFLSAQFKDDVDMKVHKNEHYFLHSYTTFLNNVWDVNQLIKPKSLIENLGKFHKKYYGLQQQDSHECLLYILDILHRSISYEIDIDIQGDILNRKDELMKKSLETWKVFFEKEYSFITETFYGNLVNNITCINCSFTEEIFEPYNNLSVCLKDNNTLQNCLDDYFQNEHLIDTWKCEVCSKTGCQKSSTLWTLPNYLIINLKRFNSEDLSKDYSMISFPIKDLNLTKYISKDKGDPNNYIYDLYAVNYHSGDVNSGHYWSACKNLDGSWYNFNDGDISKFTGNVEPQIVTKNAVILFYHRKMIKKTLQI